MTRRASEHVYKGCAPQPEPNPNFFLASPSELTHFSFAMETVLNSSGLSMTSHALEPPLSPSVHLELKAPTGAAKFEGRVDALAPVYPQDVATDISKAEGILRDDSSTTQSNCTDTADLYTSGDGTTVSIDELLGTFMIPLDLLSSSDAEIDFMELPSSEFDWSAALHDMSPHSVVSSREGHDGTRTKRPRSNTRVSWSRHTKRPSRQRQYKIYGVTATVELGDDALAEVLVFTWNPASRRWHGPGKMEVRDLVEYIKGRLTKNGRRRLISSLMYDTYKRVAVTVRQGSRRKVQMRFVDALGAWEGRCGSGRIRIGLGGLKRMLHGEATWADASR